MPCRNIQVLPKVASGYLQQLDVVRLILRRKYRVVAVADHLLDVRWGEPPQLQSVRSVEMDRCPSHNVGGVFIFAPRTVIAQRDITTIQSIRMSQTQVVSYLVGEREH